MLDSFHHKDRQRGGSRFAKFLRIQICHLYEVANHLSRAPLAPAGFLKGKTCQAIPRSHNKTKHCHGVCGHTGSTMSLNGGGHVSDCRAKVIKANRVPKSEPSSHLEAVPLEGGKCQASNPSVSCMLGKGHHQGGRAERNSSAPDERKKMLKLLIHLLFSTSQTWSTDQGPPKSSLTPVPFTRQAI